jgi:hypothetical protein
VEFPRSARAGCFPIADEKIACEVRSIPREWAQLNGLDFGYDHPFAAVNLAFDRDADVLYVTKTYRERESTPILHAAAIKPWGDWIPCAWPHDGYPARQGLWLRARRTVPRARV